MTRIIGRHFALFEVLRYMDQSVEKAVTSFNAGRLKTFKANFPFMRMAYEGLHKIERSVIEEFLSDNSIYFTFSNDLRDYVERAHESFLNFIKPSEKNLKCLEHLLVSEHYDEGHWLGFFGSIPAVNSLVAKHADLMSLSFEQSVKLYEMSETLRGRGEVETANLMLKKAFESLAERFSRTRGEQCGEVVAQVFLSELATETLFEESAKIELPWLVPYLKEALRSKNEPFDTVPMVERCMLLIGKSVRIDRAIERLVAAGFSENVLRQAPSTRREMLCEDLGM